MLLLCVLSFLLGMIVRGQATADRVPETGVSRSTRSTEPTEHAPADVDPTRSGSLRIRVVTCGKTGEGFSDAMEVMEYLRAENCPDVGWAENGDQLAVFVGEFEDRGAAQEWLAKVQGMRYAGTDRFRSAVLDEVR